MTTEKFFTLEEVAEMFKISVRSLYRYIEDGRIQAVKIGQWRIKQSDLLEFIKKNTSNHKRKK